MTTTLYMGPPNHATYPHVIDKGNLALKVIPPHPYNQTAVGIFHYNIYVSAVYDGVTAFDGVARLYVGSSANLIAPGWFLTSQPLGAWPFHNVGAGIVCVPAPPVQNVAWALVPGAGPLPVWNPQVDSPQLFGKPFALVATIEYRISDTNTQTITPGALTVDPCAAVVSCFSIPIQQ